MAPSLNSAQGIIEKEVKIVESGNSVHIADYKIAIKLFFACVLGGKVNFEKK